MAGARGWRRGVAVGAAVWLAWAAAAEEARYAVVAGCNTYADGLTPLKTSLNDIRGVRDRVLAGARCYWPAENIVTLENGQATRQRVRDALAQAAALCQDGDVFFFMFSGHGTQAYDYEYYELICLYDQDYGDWELGQDLAQFRSGVRIVVMLDTCYSGGMFKAPAAAAAERAGEPAPSFAERVLAAYREAKLADPRGAALAAKAALGANIAFMTASDKFELSWTYNSGYSIYTGFVLEAAQSAAADTDANGALTLLELHDYAVPRVIAETDDNAVQTPQSYHREVLAGILAVGEPDIVRAATPQVSVAEVAGPVEVRFLREGNGLVSASIQVAVVGESAIPGLDFQAPEVQTLTWPAGDFTPKSVTVAITDDAKVEGAETLWVRAVGASAIALHETEVATRVTIMDDDAGTHEAFAVRFAAAEVRVAENAGFATLTVQRADRNDEPVALGFRTVPGTAQAGADYLAWEGTLSWGLGDQAPRTIQVPVLPDGVWEADERFTVELLADGSGVSVDGPAAAVVTVANADSRKAPGHLRLTPAVLPVCEADGVARVTVAREGGRDGAVEVRVSALSGTAKAGVNFAATSAVLQWADGDDAPRSVEVPLLDDGAARPDLTFKLQLGSYKGGATGALGGTSTTVTLRDARAAVTLAEALECAAGTWATGGSALWYGQTGASADGADAAQVAAGALAAGKDAWLQTSVTGPGALGFSWRGGARDADALQLWVGRRVATQLVGRTAWQRVEGLAVPSGRQTLKWRFLKGAAAAEPDDAAWVDRVDWIPDAARAAGPDPAAGKLLASEQPRVAWQAAAGAAAYHVYAGPSSGALTQTVERTSERSAPLPALAAGATVYWRVDTVSAAGRVTPGAVWSFKVPSGPLPRVEPPGPQTAVQGQPFTLALATREGGPAATGFSVKGLPTGLRATAAGVISGKPTKTGLYTVAASALGAAGAGPAETFPLTVSALPPALLGSFAGLCGVGGDAAGQAVRLLGSAQLAVTASGSVSGSLRLRDGTYTFRGGFQQDAAGLIFEAALRVRTGGAATLRLRPHAEDALAFQGYRGLLVQGGETRELALARHAWAADRSPLAEYAGYYTVALPLAAVDAGAACPSGTGYLTLSLASTGAAKLAGMLADGTPWSGAATACVAPDGDGLLVPVFVTLNRGAGLLWGALRLSPHATGADDNTVAAYLGAYFSDGAPSGRSGLVWSSAAQASSRLYPEGFDADVAAAGGAYVTGNMAVEARVGRWGCRTFLSVDPVADASLDPSVAVALSGATLWLPPQGAWNPCGTTLTVSGATGLFSGGFTLNDTAAGKTVTRKVTFKGVLAPLRWRSGEAEYDAPGAGFFTVNGLAPTPATSRVDAPGVRLLWLPVE